MSLYEHQDRCLSSPDELKAVIPQATPTPSFSLESPSVSPQEPGAGNHNGRPIELSLGTAVLLRYMGAPIEPPEDSFPLSDTVIGSIKSEKEDAEGLSRPATLSSRSREDVWRKDTRQSSKNLRVFSSASISSSKSVNRSAINANIDTNPSLAHEGVSPSEDNSLHPGASKAQSSMAHHTQSHGDRLPSFSQFETEISASHNNLRHTSSILPPTHCKVLAANNPSHLPPIASFSHKEPPSILEDSYSLPEQYTQKSLLPPNPVCKPRASYLNGNSLHFLQPVDGLQPNTPSLSSVHSGSDSYSGTDGYSPDNLPSPAENTRLSNRFAHETNFARIRTQSDNPSHTPYQSAGSYKCTAANCNARPFQTQYLLNSHRNRHSENRPYLCEAEGCGKGFKRKNELKRHGLSHDSPGYVCPFCADRDHRYPRPDNLQRHVKGHHPDKQSELRVLLSRRSDGINGQGRRRRSSALQG